MKIEQIQESDLDRFFIYLDKHLRENGANCSPVFQPISVDESKVTPELKARFGEGLKHGLTDKSWRKLFVAIDSGEIVGHVDVRPYPDKYTDHRVLLGMGVDSSFRGQGVGRKLVSCIVEWVKSTNSIEYIDLWVLSNNYPAKSLYQECGFTKCGEILDMFRFDGKSQSYTMMCRHVLS